MFQTFGNATLSDNGTITADQAGKTLTLSPSFITGSGTLAATGGGILSIGGRLNGTGLKANVDATPGSQVIVDGGGLSGTLASTSGSGLSFAGNGSNFIDTATINGDLTFNGAAYAQVYNANTVSGTINMAGTSNGIQLRDGNAMLTVTSSGKIHGYGQIFQTFGNATLMDNGTITADTAAQTLALNPSNITGSGLLEAKNGAVLSIGGRLNGTGLKANVDATPGSQVIVDGGGLSGTLASTTGSGLSFSGNGGNFIDTATINGDLTFNGAAYAQVYNANSLSGTIHMAGTANGIQLRDGNAILTVTSAGAIRGYGQVFQTFGNATLSDNGTITADQAGKTLALNNSFITGSGALAATGGGILSIGGRLNGTALKANVDAIPGSQVIVDGGGLSGTLSGSTGSGLSFSGNGGNFIDTATINGDLTFGGTAYAQVYNANTLSGTIHMAGTANGIQLRDGNAKLTVNSGGKIQGYGQVFQTFGGATLANNGTVSADIAAQTLALNPSNITGSGVFEAKNGGVLSIGGLLNGGNAVVHVDADPASAVLVNGGGLTGSFAASTGSGISFAGNAGNYIDTATIAADLTFIGNAYAQVYNANSVSGTIHMAGTANGIQLRDGNATLEIAPGGKLQGYGAVFETFGGTHFVNHGTVSANVIGQTLALNNSFITNTADVSVSATLSVGGSFTQTAGHTAVDGTLSLAQTFLLQGGSLTGSGNIVGNIDNSGAIVGPGDSPGLLSVTGAYNQQSGGLFDIELGGTVAGASYDQLKVSGDATLAGSIDVNLVQGFLPFVGEQFDVMLRSSGSGTFANLLSSTPGLGYVVDYQPTRVIVTITAVPIPESATATLFACGVVLAVPLLRYRPA